MTDKKFNKVIIWGYKLYTHTHSFIHAAFKIAFEHMGYDVRWYFDGEDHSDENFDNCLFLASAEQEQNIPLNSTSCYILHNVNAGKYVDAGCKVVSIQVYNKDVSRYGLTKISDYEAIWEGNVKTLYLPWATDVLPDKFDFSLPHSRINQCVWIGTFGDSTGTFQNGQQLQPFFDQCEKNGVEVVKIDPWATPVTFEHNYELVRLASYAPALQGQWQVENNYIPCRIFKNISYGNLGITNNELVKDIFGDMVVYHPDTAELFNKAAEILADRERANNMILSSMKYVQENHTYINRINFILEHL